MIDSIWLFHCGWVTVPAGLVLPNHSRLSLRNLPFMALAAFHAERGLMLVDAPYGHEGPSNLGGLIGGALKLSVQRFERAWSIVPRVEQCGWRPSEVESILMTHMHMDHTGGLKELAHATLRLSRREWTHASTLSSVDALKQGYVPSDYRTLDTRVVTFETPERFSRDHDGVDLFDDGSVTAHALPGHTSGHTGYRFRMTDGREVFFLGDAVFGIEQITRRVGFGPFPRTVGDSMIAASDTLSELQRFHDANPDTLLLCSHDFELGEQCKHGPIRI